MASFLYNGTDIACVAQNDIVQTGGAEVALAYSEIGDLSMIFRAYAHRTANTLHEKNSWVKKMKPGKTNLFLEKSAEDIRKIILNNFLESNESDQSKKDQQAIKEGNRETKKKENEEAIEEEGEDKEDEEESEDSEEEEEGGQEEENDGEEEEYGEEESGEEEEDDDEEEEDGEEEEIGEKEEEIYETDKNCQNHTINVTLCGKDQVYARELVKFLFDRMNGIGNLRWQ